MAANVMYYAIRKSYVGSPIRLPGYRCTAIRSANIVGLSYRCYYIVHTGFVRLDYQRLTIHSTSVEIHVLPHSSASCRTIPLTVETFDLNQLSGDAFNVSQVLSCVQHASGSSNTFLVPWENTANGKGFIFKVAANVCATDETGYYQLQPNSKPSGVDPGFSEGGG